MKRLLVWWRTRVHWFWRWSLYLELLVLCFYLVEDARGALAWRSFIAKHPEFQYRGENLAASQKADLVSQQTSASKLVHLPKEFSHWNNQGIRKAFFDRRRWRGTTALNFPGRPFRTCLNWDLASQFEGSKISSEQLDKLITDSRFLELESDYRSDISQYFPLSDLEKQELLFFVTRWQLLRAQAYWQIGELDSSKELLLHCIDLARYYNNGKSIARSNQAADDVMSLIQLVWQYLKQPESFTSQDLWDIQQGLESIQFFATAERSSYFWAISQCAYLDGLKWNIGKRVSNFTETIEALTNGYGSIEACLHAFYQLWVPNGWIHHNKINVCRNSEKTASLGTHSGLRWRPTVMFVKDLNLKLDARPTEAYVRCAITAIAVERFRRDKQRLPDELSELVPKYLKELPIDPYLPEHELRYVVEDQKPIIYSVGANKKDEHGLMKTSVADGDLVWRYIRPEGFNYRDYSVQ